MAIVGMRAPQVGRGPMRPGAKGRGRPSAVDNGDDLDHGSGPGDVVASSGRLIAQRNPTRQPRARADPGNVETSMTMPTILGEQKRARAPGSSGCATICARPSSGSRTTCRQARRWRTGRRPLRAHAVDRTDHSGAAGRRRRHEPDRAAACSRRPASTPRPCTASSRRSSASRSPAPRTIRASGPRACR